MGQQCCCGEEGQQCKSEPRDIQPDGAACEAVPSADVSADEADDEEDPGGGNSTSVEEEELAADHQAAPLREDIRGEEEESRLLAARRRASGRRSAVVAECVSAAQVQEYVKPLYPKAPEVKNRIAGILAGSEKMRVLFGCLDDGALDDIVNAFRVVTRPQGEEIIRQGAEGDCLYVIGDGEVDVFVNRPGADGVTPPGKGAKVVSLSEGALFGELALMYSAPRAATVVISSPKCTLWRLDRESFRMLLAQHRQAEFAVYEGWLSEVDLLKSLNRFEMSKLSELLQSQFFEAGQDIIRQGEAGSTFYLLKDGSCAAFMTGEAGERKVKDYIRQGEYFGEIALLSNEPRKATIRATGQGATVLWLSKDDFTLLLGPIQDILRKNIDKYPEYAELI